APMMSRVRGGLGWRAIAPGACGSGEAATTSWSSSTPRSGCTVHPEDARVAEPAAEVEDDREQVVGDDDGGDQAEHDADPQRDGEALDRTRAGEGEDDAG